MKVETTGNVVSASKNVGTKTNGKSFKSYQVNITGAQGRGLTVNAYRTLGADKSEVTIGQEVTLHGDTDNILTAANGERFMPFEIQTGVGISSGADVLAAFGVKAEAVTAE